MMFTMVVTFSVFLIGIGIIQYIWGLTPKPVSSPIQTMVRLSSVKIPLYRLIIFAMAIIAYFAIQLFLQKTIVGKAIRASIENPD